MRCFLPVWPGVMYAASAVAAGHSVHKLEQNRDTTDKIIPTMGVMGAFVLRRR